MVATASSAGTLLIVRLSSPRSVAGLAPADEQHLRLEEELVFLQSRVAENPACRASRVNGDELQATFSNGDAAFAAAVALQQISLESGRSPTLAHLHLLLDQVQSGDDDAADVASPPDEDARGSQLIKQLPPDWLFATAPVMEQLRDAVRAKFRPCDANTDDEVDVTGLYRAIVHEDATTRIAALPRARKTGGVERSVSLRWRNRTLTLKPDSASLTLGRGEQADVQIESALASRIHARIVVQQSDFILADQSTNGTFIQMGDTAEIILQHEQIVLRGNGVISLGRPISQGHGKLIYFAMNA